MIREGQRHCLKASHSDNLCQRNMPICARDSMRERERDKGGDDKRFPDVLVAAAA